jgi:chaperonin GroEL
MTTQSIPGVVFEARAREGMQRGVNQLVNAVRPTLGPFPRVVAVENTFRHKTPELLDNAGVITRRIIELPDRGADVGAMLLRHMLWRVHEEAGDGTATAAIFFQAIYNRGLQYLAAGGDGLQLRRQLERGMEAILAELDRQTLPIQGQAQLTALAESLCFDEPLARILGEALAIAGEHGLVEIRTGHGQTVERQYTEGAYWQGGALAQQLLTDQTRLRADLADVAVLISDLELDDPRQLMPLLTAAMQRGIGSVLITAASIADPIMAMLLAASRDPERFRAVAVKTPGVGLVEQAEAMEDLALLTGGRRLLKAAGDSLRGITLDDLGRARRAWCDRKYMGVISGRGDPRALRRQLAALKAGLEQTDDQLRRSALRQRIGRLSGGSATVLIGGATESEIALREERARRTAELLRAALREGVVPGGGVALLACRAGLRERLAASADLDEQVACRILLRALEEPLRVIASNAGHEPADVLARLQGAAPGVGLDARSGLVVNMADAGIYDVAAALKVAIRAAISGAATALTVDTIVHKRNPVSAGGQP